MEELSLQDYLQGASNFYRFAGIKRGDQVLLLPTTEFLAVDPTTVTALTQAGKDLGADIAVAFTDDCGIRGNPPRPITRAIEASDLFLAMGEENPNPISGHCLTALKARWDYGAKQADLNGGKGVLGSECSKFPVEILLAIADNLLRRLQRGKTIEIVDDRGTHLSFPYDANDIYGVGLALELGHMAAGQRTTWPLGGITLLPGESFSGTAMVDCISELPEFFQTPVRFKIVNGWVVEIEDRKETKELKAELAKPGNASFVDKIIIGINPKASVTTGIRRSRFGELPQALGVAKIGIGDRPGVVSSHFYTTGYVLKPTILVDGEILFDHGRPLALKDPRVRETAGKFGDPDLLLEPIP